MNWSSNVNEIVQHLKRLSAVGGNKNNIPIDEALDLWIDLALSIREKQKTIFLIGNGASALGSGATAVAANATAVGFNALASGANGAAVGGTHCISPYTQFAHVLKTP